MPWKLSRILLVLGFFIRLAFAEPLPDNNAVEALHLDWIDKTVSPAKNFYEYANGLWKKQNPIPPEYASWSSFSLINEKIQTIIHEMLIKAANSSAPKGSIEQKVGDFYFSGMDEKSINQLGAEPLKPYFEKINSIKTHSQLQKVMTELQVMGVDVFFDFGSMQDYKNSQEMIGVVSQGGLGLPDRDYYLKEDKKFQEIREAYAKHIAKMFVLLGDPFSLAMQSARKIMTIESRLAKASMTQVEQRDPHAVYNKMSLTELNRLTPNFSWTMYFNDLGLKNLHSLNMAMPEFFRVMNVTLKEVPLEEWKLYLRWHLIDAYAPYLSTAFVDENFQMVSLMSGTKKLHPRWRRVVGTESSALGFAIGKLYVEKYFSPESKKQVLEILSNIRKVLKQDIENLPWMSSATKQAALKKLELMKERVGYPDKWWDYSKLVVDRGPYVLNVIRSSQFLTRRDLDKIGKPVDQSEWAMTPQTINAYYDPSMNNINLPAGILQPPFFDPKAPAAVNYGAIGSVIGHELTHGFDDQGAKFDGYGNLINWWTKEDLKKFQAATTCIVEQFSRYKVAGNYSLQGRLVIGEATADLGGITLAFRAFQRSSAYKDAKIIQGFTPEQQFFLGTAHVWANNIRFEELHNQITTDPHPPMLFRVNGTLSNMPQFHQAFGIKPPSPMINPKPCVVW